MVAILCTALMLGILIIYAKKTVLEQNKNLIKVNISESLFYWYTSADFKKASNSQQKWVLRFNNLANTLLIIFTLIILVTFSILLLSFA